MVDSRKLLKALASLKLAIACLGALMVLVIACTLAQVSMGSYQAVHRFMHAFVVWAHLPGTDRKIPVFPGGATVGLVLLVNLLVAQFSRLQLTWSKVGIWIVHAGLVVLLAGEFVAATFQVEMRLALDEGQTLSYLESPRDMELVVTDATDPRAYDEYVIPESRLRPGAIVEVTGTPLSLEIVDAYRNARLAMRQPGDPPPLASMGVGAQVTVVEQPPVTADDEIDQRAVFVKPVADAHSYGTWLVSPALGAPQSFFHEGRKYVLSMRPRREQLPYAIKLEKFRHDVYLGTDIPKNFSSLVHLSDPQRGEEREVLISMNQPLRYRGKAFYQASFGKGDTMSVLQVVDNPGWLLPYLACGLVALGLVIHFGLSMRRGVRRQAKASAAAEGSPA